MLHALQKIPYSHLSDRHKRAVIISSTMMMIMITTGIVLDQITKYQSDRSLKNWETPGNHRSYSGDLYQVLEFGDEALAKTTGPYFVLNLSYVRNPGAAWGVMAGLPDQIRVPFFNIITTVCILLICLFAFFTPRSHRISQLALALLLSGAIGNMIDRVRMNYVIDWIDVRWNVGGWYYGFPNFNVADICICIGAFLIILDGLISLWAERSRAKQPLATKTVS